MTEPDDLSIKIRELMDWQTVAWRRVADPDVTTFERREIRNHVKTCNDELRRCLAMKAERFRARGAGGGSGQGGRTELSFARYGVLIWLTKRLPIPG
jgi:hypothetical protein